MPGPVPSALHLPHLLVTTTLLLLNFIIPTFPMKELRFWENEHPAKITSWLSGWTEILPQPLAFKAQAFECHTILLWERTLLMKILPSEFYKFPQVWRHWREVRIHREGQNGCSPQESYNIIRRTYAQWDRWQYKAWWDWKIKLSRQTGERLIPVSGGGREMVGCMEEAIFQKEFYRWSFFLYS